MPAPVIDTLVGLQEIDRRNRERSLKIEDIATRRAELEAERDRLKAQADIARENADSTGVQRRELEAVLQEEERRLKERRMRMTRIRNDKELEAAQREIDGLKELSSRHEDDLITLLEQTEAVDGGLKGAEEELHGAEEQLLEHEQESAGQTQQFAKEIEEEREERERVANLLPPNLRKRYDAVFSRKGGLAVVEMIRDVCTGCNMTVPPQMANEARKGESVVTCPSCQRIIFWRIDGDEASVA